MKQRKLALAMMVAALLAMSLACNLPSPTQNTELPLSDTAPQTANEILTVSGNGTALISSAQAGTISANGAMLTIPNSAIPPDANGLPTIEELSLTVASDAEMSLAEGFTQVGPVYQLGPEGLTFGMPAKLSMPVPETFDIDLVLGAATYNEVQGGWELLPADVNPTERTVTVQAGHFSWYSIFGIADYIQEGKAWAARNGGWFQITNTYREGDQKAPFGRELPAAMYYGVCVQRAYYDDQTAETWNWTRPTDWMIGASAEKTKDGTRSQWLPAGTYIMMEFYGVGETGNWDIDVLSRTPVLYSSSGTGTTECR